MKKYGTMIGVVGSIIVAVLIARVNEKIIFPLLLLAENLLFIAVTRRQQ